MTEIKWTNARRKVTELIPADYNPRSLSDKERKDLEASVRRFDTVEPVVINIGSRENVLIGGHQRIKIYADLGIDEIDVRVPSRELDIAEETELNVRLNKNTGSWDEKRLAEMDYGMLAFAGFGKDELSKIFDNQKDSAGDNFDIDKAMPEEPKAQLGDIYQLGNHRVMCGDSTDPGHVEKLMQGTKAQMCFTDPPYNVDYQGGTGTDEQNKRSVILNDKMDKNQFLFFLENVCQNIVANTIGGIYICMSSSEIDTLKSAFENRGGHWQDFLIWVKSTFTLSRADYQHIYEPILYGWPKGATNHFYRGDRDIPDVWEDIKDIKSQFDGEYTTIKFQGFEVKIKGKAEGQVKRRNIKTDIWRYDKPTISREHPTMKPIALCSEAIKNSSMIGDIVLDLFLGSGSTLIAAEQMDRKCYGMELDPKYVDVIIKRWEILTGQTAIKL